MHFTPLVYLLCATLLILRRESGDKSRMVLAFSFIVLGSIMLGSLLYNYSNPNYTTGEILSMRSLNFMYFAFFVMLLYPREVVNPGNLGLKNIIIQFSSFLLFNAILLIFQPEFRYLSSPEEIILYLGEYNVWIRVALVISIIPLSIIIFCVPHTRTSGRATIFLGRAFCTGSVINIVACLCWIISGTDLMRLIFQMGCLTYGFIATYQELYLRLPYSAESEEEIPTVSPISKEYDYLARESTSPMWLKLTKLFDEERVWRNPDLTLVELAAKLGTNRTTLSKLIRDNGYEGFSAFINMCRIREFMHIIQNQEINGIYETFFEVGFRSKSTAIRYFRQVTGTTPSDYLQQGLANAENNRKYLSK